MAKEIYMQRALQLAQKGLGSVSPNPMVGCVIVYNDEIIGEGFHEKYGGPHAEVNAINSVKDQSLLKESEVYVNLEPCSHYGKTPPCADLLVEKSVKKVVIANIDPFEKVSGNGVTKLKNAGIEVEIGLLEQQGALLNKRFFTAIQEKRPYIILKWAQTKDGFIARANFDSKWISDERSRKIVHKWRSEEDAILVGTNTAKYDNPKLNVRDWEGRNPVRVVIDKQLKLSEDLNLFDRTQRTIVFNSVDSKSSKNLEYVKISDASFEEDLLEALCQLQIQSLIIEGGAATLASFIKKGLWDESRIFKSETTFGEGINAPAIEGTLLSSEQLVNDKLEIIKNG